MTNVAQRLLLFFIAVPLLVVAVFLMPWAKHAAVVAVILAFSAGSASELGRLFRARGVDLPQAAYIALGLAAPAAAYVGSLLEGKVGLIGPVGALALGGAVAAVAAFSPFALIGKEDIEGALPKAAALGFAAMYPGLLASFIVLIASEPPMATEALVAFCLVTFGNDSLAWLAGMTLGRKRGLVAVSPNKSLAGFIAGFSASTILPLACARIFPSAMDAPWWALLILGASVGVAGILGDLFESALKRSAGIKDSGNLVPGRGGFLDSFDSLLFAAPLFYGLSLLMGLFR